MSREHSEHNHKATNHEHQDHSGHGEDSRGHNHHDHHAHMAQDFLKRFRISLGLGVPIILNPAIGAGLMLVSTVRCVNCPNPRT